jgi:hypothetical protein
VALHADVIWQVVLRLKATVPLVVGVIVFSFCSWRVHLEAVNRSKQPGRVEITVYGPDGKIITPIFHR